MGSVRVFEIEGTGKSENAEGVDEQGRVYGLVEWEDEVWAGTGEVRWVSAGVGSGDGWKSSERRVVVCG